ncbi:hypothetical protein ACJW30_07G046400 [Castanea mollissima]
MVQAQGATETHNHSNNSSDYINSIAKKLVPVHSLESKLSEPLKLTTPAITATTTSTAAQPGARGFHKMSHPQSASRGEEIDRQACKDKCLVRSFSIPPFSPDFPRGESTSHAALDVNTIELLPPIGEENPNHNQNVLKPLPQLWKAA